VGTRLLALSLAPAHRIARELTDAELKPYLGPAGHAAY
jgi:hypothetical protein